MNLTAKVKLKQRIAALPSVTDDEGNEHPAHNHTIVKLGYLWTTEPTYNEEGEVETEGIASDMYSVDVLWNETVLQRLTKMVINLLAILMDG